MYAIAVTVYICQFNSERSFDATNYFTNENVVKIMFYEISNLIATHVRHSFFFSSFSHKLNTLSPIIIFGTTNCTGCFVISMWECIGRRRRKKKLKVFKGFAAQILVDDCWKLNDANERNVYSTVQSNGTEKNWSKIQQQQQYYTQIYRNCIHQTSWIAHNAANMCISVCQREWLHLQVHFMQ